MLLGTGNFGGSYMLQVLEQLGTGGNVQEAGSGDEHSARKGGGGFKGLANEDPLT